MDRGLAMTGHLSAAPFRTALRTAPPRKRAVPPFANGTGVQPYGPNLHTRFVQIVGNERNVRQMNGKPHD
jgi:hypothetical protein